MSLKLILPLAFTLSVLCASSTKAQESVITLAQSKLYVAADTKEQHFTENINLQQGQDKLQLSLTYFNGTATAPGFKWIRINSSTMSYLTEQNFGAKKELSVDATGELSWGGNQIIVDGAGPPGATFAWRVTTPTPSFQSIFPQAITQGETVTIAGQNLCPDPKFDAVTIGGIACEVVSATRNSVVVKVPTEAAVGESALKLKVAGLDAGAMQISVIAGQPFLTSLSAGYQVPGYPITIYGRGFSPQVANTRVTIGPFDCQIQSASVNSITVTAPIQFSGAPWGINQPVKVWINGLRSSNALKVNVYDPISTP